MPNRSLHLRMLEKPATWSEPLSEDWEEPWRKVGSGWDPCDRLPTSRARVRWWRSAEIIESLWVVTSGRAILGQAVAEQMDRYFAPRRGLSSSSAFPQLSPRELEVLDLLAGGLTNEDNSRRLVLSQKTVRNNVSNILTKLGVPTRAAAVARARSTGLV